MTTDKHLIPYFNHLWLDDPQWQKERKQQWMELAKSEVFADATAKYKKMLRDYFMFGIKEPEGYLSGSLMFLYAPFQSAEQAKLVFYSGVFFHNEFDSIFKYHIFNYRSFWPMCPQYRERVEWFIEGVMGREYELKEKKMNSDWIKCYSPEPPRWVIRYLVNVEFYFEEKPEFNAVISAFDYFLSCLSLVDVVKQRKKINKRMGKVFAMAEEVLKNDDNEPRKEFATKLLNHREKILELWAVNAHLDEDGE